MNKKKNRRTLRDTRPFHGLVPQGERLFLRRLFFFRYFSEPSSSALALRSNRKIASRRVRRITWVRRILIACIDVIRPALGPDNVCIYEPDISCGNYAKELIATQPLYYALPRIGARL